MLPLVVSKSCYLGGVAQVQRIFRIPYGQWRYTSHLPSTGGHGNAPRSRVSFVAMEMDSGIRGSAGLPAFMLHKGLACAAVGGSGAPFAAVTSAASFAAGAIATAAPWILQVVRRH
mmetsp:Transcript_61660/g.127752  ORF Transcript_61660/g.127752 Transcript_61660/m.127752 type:complete len:116 (-) Transcript_61660:402-749(-)